MNTIGNPKVYTVALVNGADVKAYPTNAVPAISAEISRARGLTIHSRGGLILKVSFRTGGIAASEFLTLDAGLYLTLSEAQQISYVEFQSTAADTVELLTTDTLGGASVTAGPSL
jgi:hypothetical protein